MGNDSWRGPGDGRRMWGDLKMRIINGCLHRCDWYWARAVSARAADEAVIVMGDVILVDAVNTLRTGSRLEMSDDCFARLSPANAAELRFFVRRNVGQMFQPDVGIRDWVIRRDIDGGPGRWRHCPSVVARLYVTLEVECARRQQITLLDIYSSVFYYLFVWWTAHELCLNPINNIRS